MSTATLAPAAVSAPLSSAARAAIAGLPGTPAARSEPAPLTGPALAERFAAVRALSEALVEPLSPEDCVVQPMDDASPAKWHLAHTTWFFEAFLLKPYRTKYEQFDPKFGFLFNSYYNALGERHERSARGLLTRPSLAEVFDYRGHVDRHMTDFLSDLASEHTARLVEVGLHHEQQHQELLLTDIKYTLWRNPLRPAYREGTANDGITNDEGEIAGTGRSAFSPVPAGLYEIGHPGGAFCYDNEQPRHRVYLHEYALADVPVTNGDWRAFMDDGGYTTPGHWLAAGWDAVNRNKWRAPLYWERAGRDADWETFTLSGMRPADDAEPVCHVSYYEADAFARWAGARLPTEQEWEVAAARAGVPLAFPPDPAPRGRGPAGPCGGAWEWTASPYVGYPGYAPPAGALGEYNGKFMSDQWVLRGGSRATPPGHARRTYRNFFPADKRWQFSGLRLAK